MTRSIGTWRFWVGARLGVTLLLTLLLAAPRALAKNSEQRPLGFSNLVLRVDNTSGIAIATDAYRVLLLERLRSHGLKAVGAESLVFAKDEQDQAEMLLGGTIRRLECQDFDYSLNCRIAVQWELLDVVLDGVVYEATTTHAAYGLNRNDLDRAGRTLALGALDSLVGRPKFRAALQGEAKPEAAPRYAEAVFQRCAAAPQAMPAGTGGAIQATVIVETETGFGSGFFLNGEGLVVTAAHVVESGGATIRQRDGSTFRGLLIRSNRPSDIALLRPETPQKTPCLPLDERRDLLGADVYAIGSPTSRELAFSVTRGIVSGARSFEGVEFWQTDASINHGNSGGPLLSSDGTVFAIASWKIVGSAVEGIAFGAPIQPGLKVLGLKPGDRTAAVVSEAKALGSFKKSSTERFVDQADGDPSLDPEGDRLRAELAAEEQRRFAERERERRRAEIRDRLTPTYVKFMKYGGPVVAVAGAVGVYASASGYDGETTQPEYQRLRLINDLSWVAVGLGTTAFVLSFVLTPSVPESELEAGKPVVTVGLGADGLSVRGSY